METPRLDRDMAGRVDGAGRAFKRREPGTWFLLDEAEHISQETVDALSRPIPGTSAFASSPAVEKEELPPAPRLGME
jgi:hypothetical protein